MPHSSETRLRPPTSKTLGWLVLVVVCVSLVVSAWTGYQAEQRAQCQSDLNAQFLAALSANSDSAAADRENLAATFQEVSETDSAEQTREILAAYEQRRAEIDAEREEYPPLPEDVCDD